MFEENVYNISDDISGEVVAPIKPAGLYESDTDANVQTAPSLPPEMVSLPATPDVPNYQQLPLPTATQPQTAIPVYQTSTINTARMVTFAGQVLDSTNEQPIPYASVIITDANGQQLAGAACNVTGMFSINADEDAAFITISASGYKPFTFSASAYQPTFELERNDQMDTVTVHSTPKQSDNTIIWILAGIVILYLLSQKRKGKLIGKIDRQEVITYLMIAAAIIGLSFIKTNIIDVIHDLLVSLGLAKGKGQEQTQQQQANPYSPWKPGFWQNAPQGAKLLPNATADSMSQTIFNAFQFYSDDFETVMGVFSQLQTQSQVSYLADRFSQQTFTSYFGISSETGVDLLTFLTNGSGLLPWDGLSDSHLKTITDYVNNLPQYTV